MSITGKTILITGASKGIGAATAREMVAQGANVALLARSAEAVHDLASQLGPQALSIAADVANYGAITKAVTDTIAHFGDLDAVVNNAGLLEPIGLLGDIGPDDWGRIVDVNIKGVYNTCHAALPHFLAKGGGSFVQVSSGAAYDPYEGWSHYCTSKAGALMITRALHLEYGHRGIRSLGLSPSTIATDMQVAIKFSGINPVSTMNRSDHNPPEAAAKIIAYLCGPGGDAHLGGDFRLKSDEGRRVAGLA